jgi:hypothetical protein
VAVEAVGHPLPQAPQQALLPRVLASLLTSAGKKTSSWGKQQHAGGVLTYDDCDIACVHVTDRNTACATRAAGKKFTPQLREGPLGGC